MLIKCILFFLISSILLLNFIFGDYLLVQILISSCEMIILLEKYFIILRNFLSSFFYCSHLYFCLFPRLTCTSIKGSSHRVVNWSLTWQLALIKEKRKTVYVRAKRMAGARTRHLSRPVPTRRAPGLTGARPLLGLPLPIANTRFVPWWPLSNLPSRRSEPSTPTGPA